MMQPAVQSGSRSGMVTAGHHRLRDRVAAPKCGITNWCGLRSAMADER